MAAKGIKVKLELNGASEYRNTMANITADEKKLQAELKKTQAEYKSSEKSVETLNKKKEILVKCIEQEKNRIEANAKMVQSAANKQAEYAQKTEALQKVLDACGKETGELTEEEKKAAKVYGDNINTIDDLKKAIEYNAAGYDAAGRAVLKYRTAITDAETQMISLNNELADTDKEMEQMASGSEEGAESIKEVGKAAQETQRQTQGFGSIIRANIASEAIIASAKAITKAVKEIATAAMQTGSDFEASMSQVAATMGMTAEEIAEGSDAYKVLELSAKQCGETTMYSASEAAEALNYLALAGYDAAKAAETLPQVLDLAAAGGLDLATASDMVTDAMAALGMETSELGEYIDEMAVTAQKSNTSVAQLGEATLVCAGTVKTAGMDIEDMNAALGVLANNGIKGAEGGTKLRNVILSLSAPTDAAAAELEKLGVETEDAYGNMRSLEAIMRDLNAAVADMGTAQKAQAIKTIFNKTDISAVNALLKSTNGEYADLKNKIENAAGAASKMADTMNNNLKGKVTILKSNLEALGISAYQVFDEELKTGVEEASKAVQRLNDSVARGDMNTSLSKLSEALGELIKKSSNFAEKVLPGLIDGAAWLIDNLDLVISLIAGITAASITMTHVIPALNAMNASWLAFKAATEGATIQQWLLNTAMSANPAGILITAISGVTAGLIAYGAITAATTKDTELLSESQKKLTDETRELLDTQKKESDNRKNTLSDIDAQNTLVKKLKDELKGYVDANGKVISSEGRVKEIVNELNAIIPDLGLSYDENTRSLSANTEELESNIEAMLRQAEVSAIQEQLTAVMKERIEIEQRMLKMEDEVTAAQERQIDAQNRYHEAVRALNAIEDEATSEYRYQCQAVNDLNIARQEEAERCSAITGPYGELESRLEALGEEEGFLKDRIGEASSAMGEQGGAAGDLADDMTLAADDIEDSWSKLKESVSDSIKSQISLFDEYKEADKTTKEQILKNMEAHVNALQSWSTNLQELSKMGISEGLLQELAKMGPDGAGYVAEFVKMSDEQLKEASKLFDTAMIIPDTTLASVEENFKEASKRSYEGLQKGYEEGEEEARAELQQLMEELGKAAPEGAAKGTKENTKEATGAVEDMAEDMAEAGNKSLEINSPSKVFARMGEGVVEGIREGVVTHINMAREAILLMSKTMVEAAILNSGRDIFFEIGYQAGEGLVEGLNAMVPAAEAAAAKLAAAAAKAAEAKLQIHSPSKVFEQIGEFTGQGFIEGFEDSVKDFSDVVNSLIPTVEAPVTNNTTGSYEIQNTINVYGTEGQSAQEIADLVDAKLMEDYDSRLEVFA